MKSRLKFAAIGPLFFCLLGHAGWAQQDIPLAAFSDSRPQLETGKVLSFAAGATNDDTASIEELPDLRLVTETTPLPIMTPHRHLLIFRRYDINVHDKAAPGGFDTKYLLVNGLHFATAMLDIALTQHCIAIQTCREGNPLVPSAPAAAYSLEFGLASLGAVTSHFARAGGSHLWFMTRLVGVGTHLVGIASGLQHF